MISSILNNILVNIDLNMHIDLNDIKQKDDLLKIHNVLWIQPG